MTEAVKVGLFTTCLVDAFRPSIALATLEVLEDAGCIVHLPVAQTCCGLTSWNMEDNDDARDMALKIIKQFEGFDYVVTPSPGCATMVRENYPTLFQKDPTWKQYADDFSARIYELTDFIRNILNQPDKLDEKHSGLIGNDLAYLLETSTKMKKQGDTRQVRHIAEAMANLVSKGGKERSS